jgi:thioredoxin 1
MTDDASIEDIREQKKERLRETLEGDDARSDGGTAAPENDGAAGESDSPSEPVHVNGAGEFDEVTGAYDVVLVDFYADWCGPCKMLEPIVEEVAAETEAVVAKVDVDANQALAGQFGVRGVPTLVLFADGEAVDEMVGMQQKESLVAAVEQHL